MAIKDSVHIDFENQKITQVLLLRGPEEDFLSSNRDIALKILTQQCRKYHQDEDTKKVIIQGF